MSDLPLIQRVRNVAALPRVGNVTAATVSAWTNSRLASRIRPGMSVAVGVGSRGIANHAALARATVDALKALKAEPFIVAAMGSHGQATPEGQRQLLADSGITEASMGVPIRTEMDAEIVGTNALGQPVYWDRNALAADGVVSVSRVKPHTDFRGRYESGLMKMLVIGFGKRLGADRHHSLGVAGLRDAMPASAEVLLARTKYLGGLAILENAREETARLEVVDRDDLLMREPELLTEARSLMGRLPWTKLEVLIVGEMGKNYSGCGLDPNVVGRYLVEGHPEFDADAVKINRLAVLDLSPESHGNGTGVGIADLTTERLLQAIDPVPTRTNVLTARFLWRTKLPFAFPGDRACIEAALHTCWQPDRARIRFAVIPNTLEVGELWASPAAIDAIPNRSTWQVDDSIRELPFDASGMLNQVELFPHSVRARRK